jgi:GntR family transcriptional regulator
VQLVEEVRHALEVGTVRAGERLPMVRALMRELTVAPKTVVKAFGELQQVGLIESRPGVRTVVVANNGEAVRKRQVKDLYERLGVLVCDVVGL